VAGLFLGDDICELPNRLKDPVQPLSVSLTVDLPAGSKHFKCNRCLIKPCFLNQAFVLAIITYMYIGNVPCIGI
jgi:hypothetical protein